MTNYIPLQNKHWYYSLIYITVLINCTRDVCVYIRIGKEGLRISRMVSMIHTIKMLVFILN